MHPTRYSKKLFDEIVKNPPPFPKKRFQGDGVVICGGGVTYFTCAWVCINMLRHLNCQLPIQLWYLGKEELTNEMQELIAPFNVECVDAYEIRKIFPARILNGWELKPYSIIHCPFERVLLLDADCLPIVNPEFLFETPQFRQTGAVFWPDYGRLEPEREIWDLCDVKYIDEPEFESGQILINKELCWRELAITMHLNEYSDFYYEFIHGDKETFHIAFRRTGKDYAMPSDGIYELAATMCQHDFQGRRIFQHRNMDKWDLSGHNLRIEGFLYEDMCFKWLDQLRNSWLGDLRFEYRYNEATCDAETNLFVLAHLSGLFQYTRVGHDSRVLSFVKNGRIGRGRAECETFWTIKRIENEFTLLLCSRTSITCILRLIDGVWLGQWLDHEQMNIELRPITSPEHFKGRKSIRASENSQQKKHGSTPSSGFLSNE